MDLPPKQPNQIQRLLDIINSESADDRTCVLVLSSNLDNRLRELLKAYFISTTKTREKKIFEGTGPLSTFSARINVSYLCGLLSEAEQHDLDVIRDIRNDFAHEEEHVDFATESVVSRCFSLRLGQELRKKRPEQKSTNARGTFRVVALAMTQLLVGRIQLAGTIGQKAPFPHSSIV
jgi:DNA-binding MltR family transcriptional regulator